jgi:hypothetical protein
MLSRWITAAWVRFELTKDFRPWRFSRPLPSTTRPPRPKGKTSYPTEHYATRWSSLIVRRGVRVGKNVRIGRLCHRAGEPPEHLT